MGWRCQGSCLPPPDFDLMEFGLWGFGAFITDRNAGKRKREAILEWAADHGIWPQEASRRWRETGCWHG